MARMVGWSRLQRNIQGAAQKVEKARQMTKDADVLAALKAAEQALFEASLKLEQAGA